MSAQRGLNRASRDLSISFERLSSGLRINRAADDAAGLAISSKLNLNSRVYSQAVRNANDGISALSIAQGALTETTGILIRLRELATGAANGAFSRTQRISSDTEAHALSNEFNRIIGSTSFNGRRLLDGSVGELAIQLGFGSSGRITSTLGQDLDRLVGNGFNSTQVHSGGIALTTHESVSADFDGDGKLDILSGTSVSGMFISYGNGDGSFENAVTIAATNGATTRVVAADFNSDGRVDFATTSGASNVNIFLNNGNGSFSEGNFSTAAHSPESIAAGDVNGDGRPDIVVGGTSSTVQVFLANSNGSLQAGVTYTGGTANRSINLADVNSDGELDIVTVRGGTGTINALLGNGDGSFQASQNTSVGYGARILSLADVNHDGILDAVTTDFQRVLLNLGTGQGGFNSTQLLYDSTVPGSLLDLTVADHNGDGLEDIHFVDLLGRVGTMLGNGDATFGAVSDSAVSAGRTYLTTGDFNADGVLDLVGSGGIASIEILKASTAQTTSLQRLDLTTREGALSALNIIDAALLRVGLELGTIGSAQSRLTSALNTVSDYRDNYAAASSRISDADIAEESANLVRSQILQRTASAVLAQANQTPSLLLEILKQA